MKTFFFFVGLIILFSECGMGGGTHGSIKAYQYTSTKYQLQFAVERTFKNNSEILQKDKYINYYNNDTNYITFQITKTGIQSTYIIKYGGSKEDWDTSKVSMLSVAYAYNKNGKGGSEGEGGISWYDFGLKKELLVPFESEFIEKVDKELGIRHVEVN